MLTGLPEVAPEEDDDELQAAAVRASSATPAVIITGRRGVRPWMRTVISASDHVTETNRREKTTILIPTKTGGNQWSGASGTSGASQRGCRQGTGGLERPDQGVQREGAQRVGGRAGQGGRGDGPLAVLDRAHQAQLVIRRRRHRERH